MSPGKSHADVARVAGLEALESGEAAKRSCTLCEKCKIFAANGSWGYIIWEGSPNPLKIKSIREEEEQ